MLLIDFSQKLIEKMSRGGLTDGPSDSDHIRMMSTNEASSTSSKVISQEYFWMLEEHLESI